MSPWKRRGGAGESVLRSLRERLRGSPGRVSGKSMPRPIRRMPAAWHSCGRAAGSRRKSSCCCRSTIRLGSTADGLQSDRTLRQRGQRRGRQRELGSQPPGRWCRQVAGACGCLPIRDRSLPLRKSRRRFDDGASERVRRPATPGEHDAIGAAREAGHAYCVSAISETKTATLTRPASTLRYRQTRRTRFICAGATSHLCQAHPAPSLPSGPSMRPVASPEPARRRLP